MSSFFADHGDDHNVSPPNTEIRGARGISLADERDALQGSVDALRKYARMLEKRSGDSPETIQALRKTCVVADLLAEHNVAHLFE